MKSTSSGHRYVSPQSLWDEPWPPPRVTRGCQVNGLFCIYVTDWDYFFIYKTVMCQSVWCREDLGGKIHPEIHVEGSDSRPRASKSDLSSCPVAPITIWSVNPSTQSDEIDRTTLAGGALWWRDHHGGTSIRGGNLRTARPFIEHVALTHLLMNMAVALTGRRRRGRQRL